MVVRCCRKRRIVCVLFASKNISGKRRKLSQFETFRDRHFFPFYWNQFEINVLYKCRFIDGELMVRSMGSCFKNENASINVFLYRTYGMKWEWLKDQWPILNGPNHIDKNKYRCMAVLSGEFFTRRKLNGRHFKPYVSQFPDCTILSKLSGFSALHYMIIR